MATEPKTLVKKNELEAEINEKQVDVDYDELLSSAGELGKYQVLMFVYSFPFYMFGVLVYFQQMFITEPSQKYWCRVPALDHLSAEQRLSFAVPADAGSRFGIAQCRGYTANWTEVLRNNLVPNTTWETAPCQHGWEFDKTDIPYETISSELGWVCDKGSYQAIAQSVFFFGCIVGGFLFGWVGDRYGRLPAVIGSSVISCIGGVASIFTKDLILFSVTRFIVGMGYDNCMIMMYLLVLEYVAPRYRSLFSNLAFSVFYSVFATILPWLALFCGHWKTISIITSLPMGFALLAPLFFSESPRWLLSKGRVDECIKKILVIGRTNNKIVPDRLIQQFKMTLERKGKEEEASCLEILKRPMIRRMFILISVEYMCCGVVFDALIRSIGQLDFDFFASFSLMSLTEFPSMLLVAFILDLTGRRWLCFSVMIFCSVFCVLTVCVPSGVASVMCAMLARFAVNMSTAAAAQWTAELLPTSVRGTGSSVVHIFGFLATFVSPYIAYLNVYISWLPAVIMGAIAALGGVIALALPETARKTIPHTFDDAEELGRSQEFWELPCLKKRVKEDINGEFNNSFEM